MDFSFYSESLIFAILLIAMEKTGFVQTAIIHYVGSKNNLDPLVLSKSALSLDEETKTALQDNLLRRFRGNEEYYSFTHASSLQFNEVFQYCKKLFAGEPLEEVSREIAKHLYEQSVHPRVKGGELYVVHFKDVTVSSGTHEAIGLFKTENKSLFLDVTQEDQQINLAMREGVELGKIDKGCLIIDHREEEGYDVLIFDNQNRGEEALYWKEKFLGLTPQQNEFHNTAHFLSMTKQFITGQLETELKIPKNQQVELLHRSLDYFKSNESFHIEAFQEQVLQKEEVIDSFRRFGSRYVENTDYDIAASFDISPDAVRKQSRIYKSVLKLDRNFHIYIHGRTDLIEKGVDLDGRKYYKIYYQEEN